MKWELKMFPTSHRFRQKVHFKQPYVLVITWYIRQLRQNTKVNVNIEFHLTCNLISRRKEVKRVSRFFPFFSKFKATCIHRIKYEKRSWINLDISFFICYSNCRYIFLICEKSIYVIRDKEIFLSKKFTMRGTRGRRCARSVNKQLRDNSH